MDSRVRTAGMLIAGCLLSLALALVVISGSSASSEPDFPTFEPDTRPPPPGKTAKLSDERTVTFSAYVSRTRRIYAAPNESAPPIERLRRTTETGRLESYVVLKSHTDKKKRSWVQVRVPGNPNGRVGWVLRDALENLKASRWLILVDRGKRKMTVYLNGKRHWERPVGVGKPSTPTPAGHYAIRSLIKVTKRSSLYWPYALGTSAYSSLSEWPGGGVVGIHGDAKRPWLIPGAPSHGCIRMHNADVTWLAHRVTVGTPLWIV